MICIIKMTHYFYLGGSEMRKGTLIYLKWASLEFDSNSYIKTN